MMLDIQEIKQDALAIRKKFLKMHYEAKAGHIGTGLSCIDLLAFIYKKWKKPEDFFILSKGQAASALYATLNHFGVLSSSDLKTYYKDGTLLAAHPPALAFSEIFVGTGSLGHGLPIAVGMVFANRYTKLKARVACLISDGECNEGSVWEAALFAGHHQLKDLSVIVDLNGLQGFGKTSEVLSMEPLARKWESFGFLVREIDGHDFSQMHLALQNSSEKPLCIIARTIKGKGISFMENQLEWHYLPLSENQFYQAIQELDRL